MVKSRAAGLALVMCLGAGLAACGTASAQPAAAVGSPRHGAVSGQPGAGCPQGRLLPAGQAEAIDYVDFLRYNGRSYDAGRQRVPASQLGETVTHVRCSLVAKEDQRRGPPPIINGTASFLPVGTPVYQVHGYPPACRLAAYLHGSLHLYLARAQPNAHPTGPATAEVRPCA